MRCGRYRLLLRPVLRLGTRAPFLRASERPMAIACLRLFTFFPLRPLLSVPFLRLRIALSTVFDAPREYLRAMQSLLVLCRHLKESDTNRKRTRKSEVPRASWPRCRDRSRDDDGCTTRRAAHRSFGDSCLAHRADDFYRRRTMRRWRAFTRTFQRGVPAHRRAHESSSGIHDVGRSDG